MATFRQYRSQQVFLIANKEILEHDEDFKFLIGDASDLQYERPIQLYTDPSAGEGVILLNPLTDNITRWKLRNVDYKGEEISNTVFEICDESVLVYPNMKGYRLVIFND